MSGATLTQLLDTLGHTPDEHVAICHQHPGQPFTPRIVGVPQAHQTAQAVADGADVWFSVNPVQPGTSGRGTANHVTRWAALYADLDAKTGGLPDLPTAQAVVDTLTDLLGTKPAAVTFSGHGLQPFWALDPDDDATHLDTDTKRAHAQATLRRFGRLVTAVAERHHGAVDSVYDLARVLRAPGTTNHKTAPVPVVTVLPGGSPLSVDQVLDVLDAYGIPHLTDDDQTTGEQVSDPTGWTHGQHTCGYAKTMIDGWNSDNPPARHPWFLAQATRLAAAHRNSCLTPTDHTRATQALNHRLEQLLATGDKRALSPGELADGHAWGRARAAAMTDTHLQRELGGHIHLIPGEAARERPLTLIRGDHTPQPATAGNTALAVARPDTHIPAQVLASLTDHGNAQLLIAAHGQQLRYVPSRGQWLTWTGQRWAWCEDDGEAIQAATDAIHSLAPRDDAERKHKVRSLSRRGLEAAAALARRDARIRVTADQLDADPHKLNTPSGVVDVRTGTLTPAAPDQLHTRITGVPYTAGAAAPRWQQFLADTFQGDQEMIAFIQRLAGYSAAGVVTHHVLPFLHGAGGNGKSVFLDVLIALLGDYASTAPADFLMTGGREDENAVARLAGLRLVVCSEVAQGSHFNEAKIKLLTGGDRLTARFLYQRHFTFTPSHTLWLMANHQPKVDAGGESFWRRLRLLPFTTVVPAEQRVEGLAQQLIDAEGPGILAWIIDGARDVLAHGLREPDSVMAATAQYAEEEDALARFVAERCHVGGGSLVRVATRDMRSAYENWCRDEGEKPLSRQLLGRELRTRYGITDPRSNGRRYYAGVTLLEHEDDDGAPDEQPVHWTDR